MTRKLMTMMTYGRTDFMHIQYHQEKTKSTPSLPVMSVLMMQVPEDLEAVKKTLIYLLTIERAFPAPGDGPASSTTCKGFIVLLDWSEQ